MRSRVLIAPSVAILTACMMSEANASQYSDAVMASNPVAYYRLNETTGTVAANSSSAGSTLNGNFIGYTEGPEDSDPITIGQAGPRPGDSTGTYSITGLEANNRAIHSGINFTSYPTMSGDNPRVEVPDFEGNPLDITGALTLEAWVYRDPQTATFALNNEGIVDKYQGSGAQRSYELVLQANNASLRFIISRFGVYEDKFDLGTVGDVVPLGEWTYVAATYVPSTRMAIFVNGVKVTERTDSANVPPFIFNSLAPLWIGTQLNINNNSPTTNGYVAFEGRLDEVAVYDAALDDATILAHYQAAASVAPPILPGDYNNDHIVDAADYVVWRNSAGTTVMLPNDMIGGEIGPAHYNQWKSHFGAVTSLGSLAVATIPEPPAICLVLLGALPASLRFNGRRRTGTRQTIRFDWQI